MLVSMLLLCIIFPAHFTSHVRLPVSHSMGQSSTGAQAAMVCVHLAMFRSRFIDIPGLHFIQHTLAHLHKGVHKDPNKHLVPYPGTTSLAAIGLLRHVVKVTLQGSSLVGGLYGPEKRQR